jgi:pimeloyl-ACP methyl ester carboxylesterase
MPTQRPFRGEYRAPNGIFYKVTGNGEPLLLLHGLMVTGAMFDPLVVLLQSNFRMIIPDLRGHGQSGDLSGPYDVPSLTADLGGVLEHAGFENCAVLGYSHGGAVAQQLAHTRRALVNKMMLTCTYAYNVATPRERMEASVFLTLLTLFTPRTLANLVVQPSKPKPVGEIGLNKTQVDWLRALMATNRAPPMRGAVRGMVTFDSRPWLGEIRVPTLVVGGTHDTAVPQYHFDQLVNGIPGARGLLVERAGHPLIWTHTRELAEIVQTQWQVPANSRLAAAAKVVASAISARDIGVASLSLVGPERMKRPPNGPAPR